MASIFAEGLGDATSLSQDELLHLQVRAAERPGGGFF
jgi:hypothetical protein